VRSLSSDDEACLALIAQLASHLSNNSSRCECSAARIPSETMTFEQNSKRLQLAAKAEYEARGLRTAFFGDEFFGEPAWDILLDLYIQQTQSNRTSVTSACIAARVPSTTALRWVGLLHHAGLICRQPDPEDCRRSFLELTVKGFSKMEAYLQKRCETVLVTQGAAIKPGRRHLRSV